VFQSKVLKKIFGSNIVIEIKSRSTTWMWHVEYTGKWEIYTKHWPWNLKESDQLADLGTDGKVILKWISGKCAVTWELKWTGTGFKSCPVMDMIWFDISSNDSLDSITVEFANLVCSFTWLLNVCMFACVIGYHSNDFFRIKHVPTMNNSVSNSKII
jgi:hypothetical protein